MRFLSLLLIFSLALCYSDVSSARILNADSSGERGYHCGMTNHHDSDKSQVFIQNVNTADLQHFQCCSEVLTNSSIKDNLGYKALEVLYFLDFPTSLETSNSKSIDLRITKCVHSPPDIYLSVSSFLL
jgi:hypothetical protein